MSVPQDDRPSCTACGKPMGLVFMCSSCGSTPDLTSAPQDEAREKFEEWAKAQGDTCSMIKCTCLQHISSHERYDSTFTEWEWKAWQAASAELASLTQQIEDGKRREELAELILRAKDSIIVNLRAQCKAAERQVSELKEVLRQGVKELKSYSEAIDFMPDETASFLAEAARVLGEKP